MVELTAERTSEVCPGGTAKTLKRENDRSDGDRSGQKCSDSRRRGLLSPEEPKNVVLNDLYQREMIWPYDLGVVLDLVRVVVRKIT